MSDEVTPQAAAKKTLDVVEIQRLLPHRYPFLMIDRVLDMTPGQKIVAVKNVTVNEEFFNGHFPGRPIMPGVLQIEAMAQAGAILMLSDMAHRESKLIVFTGIEKAKFRRQIVPGDQLRFEVQVLQFRRMVIRMEGAAYVGDQLACEATFSAAMVDLPKPGANQAAVDANDIGS